MGPGQVHSTLALNKAGTFVLDYRAKSSCKSRDKDATPVLWTNKKVRCFTNDEVEIVDASASDEQAAAVDDAVEQQARPCTATEIEREKAKFEKEEADRVAAKRQGK